MEKNRMRVRVIGDKTALDEDIRTRIAELEEEMRLYAKELNFEMAAQVRDALIELKRGM